MYVCMYVCMCVCMYIYIYIYNIYILFCSFAMLSYITIELVHRVVTWHILVLFVSCNIMVHYCVLQYDVACYNSSVMLCYAMPC